MIVVVETCHLLMFSMFVIMRVSSVGGLLQSKLSVSVGSLFLTFMGHKGKYLQC